LPVDLALPGGFFTSSRLRGEVTIKRGGTGQLQDPTAAADDRVTLRNTVISAACLGIVWPGDVVLYVVLPLYAADFGLDALEHDSFIRKHILSF
jgi:hypothetical protein